MATMSSAHAPGEGVGEGVVDGTGEDSGAVEGATPSIGSAEFPKSGAFGAAGEPPQPTRTKSSPAPRTGGI
jgi:hypothetical protein